MSEIKLASRYARAFLDFSEDRNILEEAQKHILVLVEVLKQNRDLRVLLSNPTVSAAKKLIILKKVFTEEVPNVLYPLFDMMLQRRRAGLLFSTALAFTDQYNLKKKLVKALLTVAHTLSEENQRQLIDKIKTFIDGKLLLTTQTDSSLIGGFILRVHDYQLDASIATCLKRLKQHLHGHPIHPS